MNKLWGYNVHHGDYSQQYCILYFEVAKKVHLKYYHHKHTPSPKKIHEMREVLTYLMVVIIFTIYQIIMLYILNLQSYRSIISL